MMSNKDVLIIFMLKTDMKYCITFLFIVLLTAGCKPKVLSGEALKKKLIETMSNYLDTTLQPGEQFKIKSIIYFTDVENKQYLCHFDVDLHYKRDTSGIMVATITNDFKKISRTQ
jgi:hypothetical protein